jgi:hypothetical protein
MVVAANPTPTSRLRLEKQTVDSNENAWGTRLNSSLDLVDLAFSVEEVTVSGDVTLTSTNYADDQSRPMCLVLSGDGGFTVTCPAVDKPYLIINNCTAAVTMTPDGGTGVSVRAGFKGWFYTNAAGTIGYVADLTLDQIKTAAADVALGGNKLTGVGTATSTNDAATLANKIHEFTAPTAALAMNSQKITSLADGVDANDAVNVSQTTGIVAAAQASADAASSSASAASSSASAASTSASNASNAQSYAEEWATKAEDSLVSVPAGGDGSTDYSALHWAAKAAASAASIGTEFADDTFRIQDEGDATKQIAFQASGITTGTTRTLTVPDASGTLALTSDLVTPVRSSVTTATLSDDATADFTIPSGADKHVFEFISVIPATDAVFLQLLASTDSGSNYNVSIHAQSLKINEGATSAGGVYTAATTTGAMITGSANGGQGAVGSSANEFGINGSYTFSQLSGSYGYLLGFINVHGSGGLTALGVITAIIETTSTITNLRFKFNSGNIESGVIAHLREDY